MRRSGADRPRRSRARSAIGPIGRSGTAPRSLRFCRPFPPVNASVISLRERRPLYLRSPSPRTTRATITGAAAERSVRRSRKRWMDAASCGRNPKNPVKTCSRSCRTKVCLKQRNTAGANAQHKTACWLPAQIARAKKSAAAARAKTICARGPHLRSRASLDATESSPTAGTCSANRAARRRFAPRPEMTGVIMARAVIVPAPKIACGYATARPAGATPVHPRRAGREEWPSG